VLINVWRYCFLSVYAHANNTATRETIEDTVTANPQYFGLLIVWTSDIFLTKQWIGKLTIVMSIATIKKININESIIIIYPILNKPVATLKNECPFWSRNKRWIFAVFLINQAEPTRTFGEYPLESEQNCNI